MLAAWFLASYLLSTAFGQITGELRGLISDPTGAAVPAASVTLISKETGEKRQFSADPEGRYAFPLLKVGDYRLEVEAAGFRRSVSDAPVRSAEIIAVNFTLEVGQVNEQVVVTDAVSQLDTQSAQLQESFDARKVQEIPVARNPNNIAATLPGIVPAPGGFNSGSFITNGNRARANNITIDNITATDVSSGGTGSTNNGPLNFSSIREVKIITNSFSAEFGRNSGAQVQYITKSGTNDFHGELYEFFRNDKLNARDFFDTSGKAPVTRYNQFGGVFGGPLIRNKTHFFVASELALVRGAGGARIAQVPTAAMRAAVTDPTSRRLLEQYQLPAAQNELANFGTVQQSSPNLTDFYQWSARLDHQLTAKDTLWGRIGRAQNDGTAAATTFIGTNLANFGFASTNAIYSANLNETHIFTPNLLNEVRAGFGRTSPVFSIDTTAPLGPRIAFANGQIASFGPTENGPQGRIQNTYQIGDTLTWVRGAHNVKAGGDFFRYQLNSFFDLQNRGVYTFLNWDDFANGRPSAFVQRIGNTVRGNRTWLGGFFVQDDFRLTPRLTLNLGFRYELYGATTEVNNLTSNLNLDCRESLGAAGTGPLGCFTVGGPITATNRYAQPRLGIAWNPRGGKTVLRAGYGLVADFNFLNPITNQRALVPYAVNAQLNGIGQFTGGNSFANLVAGTSTLQQTSFAQVGRIRTDWLNFSDINPVIDPKLANPQVHSWSLSLQRELPQNFVLKLAYVGTKANYLQRARQINLNANRPQPATSLEDEAARLSQFQQSFAAMTGGPTAFSSRTDRRFNIVNLFDNSANSNFHALEVLAHRPFKGGYSLQFAYTWSKSIDDVSDSLLGVPNDSTLLQNPLDLRGNRGLSGFDVPHRVVLTHVWELPFGKGITNPVLGKLVRGWGMSGISSWRAGFPITFEAGPRLGVQTISLITVGGILRPNATGPVNFQPAPAGSAGAPNGLNADPVANRRIATYAESLGLSQPLLGNVGTLGRSTNRLNGLAQFDWNAYKRFEITERVNLQLRCEIYNVFNHHAFQDVNRNISNPAFGQYTTVAQSQRIFQLAGVLRF
ncbi:MAG: TonB-dependent receptor [Bryobacterales bacterium]|nr:TonB-dependent receptor [Bryobacterales bacterium]